jgi:hypothetical protein
MSTIEQIHLIKATHSQNASTIKVVLPLHGHFSLEATVESSSCLFGQL